MNALRIRHTHEIIKRARALRAQKKYVPAWKLLKDAHIFAQPYAGLHFYVHIEMFILALKQINLREIAGQIPRLILAIPGSATKRYPSGNPGTSDVSMFKPTPLSKSVSHKLLVLEKLEKKRIKDGGEISEKVPLTLVKVKGQARL